jgi:hypothetical protein
MTGGGIVNLCLRSIWVFLAAATFCAPASARDAQSDAVARSIIRECAAIYHAHRPCACPEDRARNGSRCGRRSAYSRLGGARPFCYVTDVAESVVADYRAGRKSFLSRCEAVR